MLLCAHLVVCKKKNPPLSCALLFIVCSYLLLLSSCCCALLSVRCMLCVVVVRCCCALFSSFFDFLVLLFFFLCCFPKQKVCSFLFFCISFKYFLLLALVSEFNCFLRSRCSMEMWCPDDIGRDGWDWVGPPVRVESMLQLPRVGWRLLAC